MNQGTADIVLKKDDDYQDDRREEVVEDPVEGIETANLGGDIDNQKDCQTEQHLYCPRAFNEQDDPINDEGDQQDVEQIQKPPEICQHLEHPEHPQYEKSDQSADHSAP